MNGSRPANLLPPKVLEPRWRQLSVPNRVLDVFVPEIGLALRFIPTCFGTLWVLLAPAWSNAQASRPNSLEPPKRPQLIAEDGMGAGRSRLDPAHMQGRGFELDLIPP